LFWYTAASTPRVTPPTMASASAMLPRKSEMGKVSRMISITVRVL
jgi:hypothetical protein